MPDGKNVEETEEKQTQVSGGQKQDQPPEREEQAESLNTPRLEKMVSRMKVMAKQVPGFKIEKLKGKNLEDQYDLLEFYLDNIPVLDKNKKIIPEMEVDRTKTFNNVIISTDPNTGRKNYSVDLINSFDKIKNKK